MTTSILKSKKLQSIILFLAFSFQAFCQDISRVNSELKNATSSLTDLLDTILTILLIASFVFMVSNIVFSYTDQKKSYTTFIIVLVLKGMFTLIF